MTEDFHGVPLPPAELIFMDRDPRRGCEHGIALARRLTEIGVDTSDGLFCDIGCGYGRLAYGILGSEFAGEYVGLDILPDRIGWLQANFTPARPRFRFELLPVRNDVYVERHPVLSKSKRSINHAVDPSSGSQAVEFRRFLTGKASAVVLLSVFTHMYDRDIVSYLSAVRNIMDTRSRLLFTAFLYDDSVLERIEAEMAHYTIAHPLNDHCRTQSRDTPLGTIAYERRWLDAVMREQGFSHEVIAGSWSGLPAKEHQDWILARLADG